MARGALVTLDQQGIKVGRDIKIATHANRGSDVLRGHEKHITRLEIDPAEIASAMFAMLERLIEGGQVEATTKIAPQLVR
jgi:DNA-binding LacI/PurR family transcriptional regulator